MAVSFLPKTKLGKFSVGTFVTFLAIFILKSFVQIPPGGPDSLLILVLIFAPLVWFLTGMLAMLWKKDYSVLLIILIFLFFAIILWWIFGFGG